MKNICKYSLLFAFSVLALNSLLEAKNRHLIHKEDIVSKFNRIKQVNNTKSETERKETLDSIVCKFGLEAKFLYDNKGRNILLEYPNFQKIEITYEDKYISSEKDFSPDLDNEGEWILFSRQDYTYENDILKTQTLSTYDETTQEWLLREKYDFITDKEDHKLISYTLYRYDISVEALLPFEKSSFEYDNNNNNTSISTAKYDITSDKWFNTNKKDNFFNSNNVIDSSIHYKYVLDKFISVGKTLYTYDKDINTVTLLSYDTKNSVWVEELRTEYFYEKENNPNLIYPISLNTNKEKKIIAQKVYEKMEKMWLEPHISNFFYSEKEVISISSPAAKTDNLRVFPNPAQTEINVVLESDGNITIYDIQGKVIIKDNVIKDKKIDIQSLEKGLYMYTIISKEGKISGKFLKQ